LAHSGLGTGISASAFARHNISTTIVEIDPAVYAAARQYFGLSDPGPGKVFLQDAKAWVTQKRASIVATDTVVKQELYDIVVHDCFSGGAVPKHIYTLEFWQDLKTIMNPEGVLAVVSLFRRYFKHVPLQSDTNLVSSASFDRILQAMQAPMLPMPFYIHCKKPLENVVCSMIRSRNSLKNSTKTSLSTWCAVIRGIYGFPVLTLSSLGLLLRHVRATSFFPSRRGVGLPELISSTAHPILFT
jgi:hypothetical protein